MKKSIKNNLIELFGKDGEDIFAMNFPPVKRKTKAEKEHEKVLSLIEKGADGEKLTAKQKKEINNYFAKW